MQWKLDQSQREAVESIERAVMVVAGPGTGKTRVLTARAAWLIEREKVDPSRIIAITYTNRAAAEMRSRLSRMESDSDLGNVSVLTFHAWAYRLARKYSDVLGFDREPVVYDEDSTEQFLRRLLVQKKIPEEFLPIRYIKNLLDRVKATIACPISDFRIDQEHREIVYDLFRSYQQELAARSALDFSDILLSALRLLMCNPSIQEEESGKIDQLLIDEFQDINTSQYLLVKYIWREGMGLFAVGDEDQTIYTFRGSSGEFINSFVSEFNAKLIPLGKSYRCSNSVLYAAGSLIGNNLRHYQIPPRAPKTIRENPPIAIFEMEDEEEEARLVSKQVRAWLDTGCSFRDIAVLYRVHHLANECERMFLDEGIPLLRLGPDRQRREIPGDPTPFLRLAITDTEWDWERAIGLPRDRLGELDDLRLRLASHKENKSLDKIIAKPSKFSHLSPLARFQLRKIHDFVKELRKLSGTEAPSMLIHRVANHLGETRSPWRFEEDRWLEREMSEISNLDNFPAESILEAWRKSKEGIRIFHAPTVTGLISAVMLERACREVFMIRAERMAVPYEFDVHVRIPVDARPAVLIGLSINADRIYPAETLLQQALYIGPDDVRFDAPVDHAKAESFRLAMMTHALVAKLAGFRPGGAPGEELVFFDLETTGTDILSTEIVEIAAVRIHLKSGEIREAGEFHSLVKPLKPIPKSASDVHGILDHDVKDAPSLSEALQKFLEFAGDNPLIGHNIEEFDFPIIKRCTGKVLNTRVNNLTLDTLPMARRLFPGESHRLEALAAKLQVMSGTSHRALNDVRNNINVFKRMLDLDESVRARAYSAESPLELALAHAFDESTDTDPIHLRNAAARYTGRFKNNAPEIPLVKLLCENLTQQASRQIHNMVKGLHRQVYIDDDDELVLNARVEFLRGEALRLEDEYADVSLAEFLSRIALLTDSDFDSEEDAVRMMTLHAAKGLEFDRVFLIGLEQGNLPHRLALNKTVDEVEEERRLFYVGLTRAREKVAISHVRRRYGRWCSASMFLHELPRNAVKKLKSRDRLSR